MHPPSPDDIAPATNEIDLSMLGRALVARKWWVLGPTLAAFLGAVLFVGVVKPRYTSDARLLLENQDDYYERVDRNGRADPNGPDAEGVQSQIQLLTSRDLARRVIRKLGLQGNEEFDPLADGVGLATRFMTLVGLMRDPTLMSPEERILEKYFDRLAVLSPNKTRVISIEFTSRDPDLAARGANVVAETYIEMQQEAKRGLASAAARSLETLVADLRARVAEAEAKVEAYRSSRGLLIGANNTIIPTQQLGDLNKELSSARAAQADAEAKANLLREMLRQKRVGEIPDVANNETMRRIFERRVALRAQLALEQRTLLPMHPRIKELDAQLADLDAQWRAAAERTAHTLENDASIAAARVERLTRALDDQKRVAGAAGAEEVKLRELERAAKVLKEQLESETTKYQEALARERVKATPADARTIQRALAPQIPSFPRRLPIVLFATLAGFVLALGVVISGELLTGRARVSSDAAPAGPAPQPPETVRTPEPVGAAEPEARMATQWLRFPVSREAGVKVLIAPCAEPGPRAETAVALARALALQGRALLVAADPGADVFDHIVGSSESRPGGMGELASGALGFDGAIHRDRESTLHVLPGGAPGGARAGEGVLLVPALARAYDFVVFAASSGAAIDLAPHMDLAFVAGDDEATKALADNLTRLGVETHLLDAMTAGDLAA